MRCFLPACVELDGIKKKSDKDRYQWERIMRQDKLKERRSRLEIYYDILNAMREESVTGNTKPTKIQNLSNLAYDKLVHYLEQLEKKKMILRNPLSLTDRGLEFLRNFDKIKDFLDKMGIEYMRDENGKTMRCLI